MENLAPETIGFGLFSRRFWSGFGRASETAPKPSRRNFPNQTETKKKSFVFKAETIRNHPKPSETTVGPSSETTQTGVYKTPVWFRGLRKSPMNLRQRRAERTKARKQPTGYLDLPINFTGA